MRRSRSNCCRSAKLTHHHRPRSMASRRRARSKDAEARSGEGLHAHLHRAGAARDARQSTLTGKVEKLSAGGEKQDLTRVADLATQRHRQDRGDARRPSQQVRRRPLSSSCSARTASRCRISRWSSSFAPSGFQRAITTIALRTDERGRVELGALAGIARVEARRAEWAEAIAGHSRVRRATWPRCDPRARGRGDPRAVASARCCRGRAMSRCWKCAAGRSCRITVAASALSGSGFLEIKGLAAGRLLAAASRRRRCRAITIRVTAGERWELAGLRRIAQLEVRDAAPVQIESVEASTATRVVDAAAQCEPVHARSRRGDAFPAGDGTLFGGLAGFTRFDPASSDAGAAAESLRRGPRDRRRVSLHPRAPLREDLSRQHAHAARPAAQSVGGAFDRSGGAGDGRDAGARRSRRRSRGARAKAPEPQRRRSARNRRSERGKRRRRISTSSPMPRRCFTTSCPTTKGVVRIDRKALGRPAARADLCGGSDERGLAHVRAAGGADEVSGPAARRGISIRRSLSRRRRKSTVLSAGQTLTLADILTVGAGDLRLARRASTRFSPR